MVCQSIPFPVISLSFLVIICVEPKMLPVACWHRECLQAENPELPDWCQELARFWQKVQRGPGPKHNKININQQFQTDSKCLRDFSAWFVFTRAGLEKLRAICIEAFNKTLSPSTSSQFAVNIAGELSFCSFHDFHGICGFFLYCICLAWAILGHHLAITVPGPWNRSRWAACTSAATTSSNLALHLFCTTVWLFHAIWIAIRIAVFRMMQ